MQKNFAKQVIELIRLQIGRTLGTVMQPDRAGIFTTYRDRYAQLLWIYWGSRKARLSRPDLPL